MKTSDITVELIDRMGNDLFVANVARVSMNKFHDKFLTEDTDGKKSDAGLIAFLASNGHWSPFAHAIMSFRVKAPIFVARQLQKHTVGGVWNEVSRRYVDDEPEFYIPALRKRAPNVKQGSLEEIINDPLVETLMKSGLDNCLENYENMLEAGVAPEIARAVLPQSMMTQWIWTGSLYFFARVCNLRLEAHAQKETRQVAEGIYNWMQKLFPVSTKHLVKEGNNG